MRCFESNDFQSCRGGGLYVEIYQLFVDLTEMII